MRSVIGILRQTAAEGTGRPTADQDRHAELRVRALSGIGQVARDERFEAQAFIQLAADSSGCSRGRRVARHRVTLCQTRFGGHETHS